MLFTEFNMKDALEVRGEEKFTEGKAEGKAESILDVLAEYGEVPEAIKDKVCNQKDMEVLRQWLKIAVRVSSVEEFCKAVY